jgi:hypothetical protein
MSNSINLNNKVKKQITNIIDNESIRIKSLYEEKLQ